MADAGTPGTERGGRGLVAAAAGWGRGLWPQEAGRLGCLRLSRFSLPGNMDCVLSAGVATALPGQGGALDGSAGDVGGLGGVVVGPEVLGRGAGGGRSRGRGHGGSDLASESPCSISPSCDQAVPSCTGSGAGYTGGPGRGVGGWFGTNSCARRDGLAGRGCVAVGAYLSRGSTSAASAPPAGRMNGAIAENNRCSVGEVRKVHVGALPSLTLLEAAVWKRAQLSSGCICLCRLVA